MVKYEDVTLNNTFSALSDATRRQIVSMLLEKKQRPIKELAEPFDMSLVAVSKHIKVLERAKLVKRFKRGRESYLELNPVPLRQAKDWLAYYEQFWSQRFAALESLLATDNTQD